MPFHVRITTRPANGRVRDELALDLRREELEQRFLEPRRRGQPVTLAGRTLGWDEIERIRINQTQESSADLLPRIRAERRASRVAAVGITDQWYVTKEGVDVTDQLIFEAVGSESVLPDSDGPWFHVHATRGMLRRAEEFNLTERELLERFVDPWRAGEQVSIGDKTFAPADTQLTIYGGAWVTSNQKSFGQGWLNVIKFSEDVSGEYLTGVRSTAVAAQQPTRDPRDVAVAYGRDEEAVDAIFDFLQDLGLRPLRWGQLRAITGKASPYTGEIVDTAFAVAQAVVVLFTPDDEARLHPALGEDDVPASETELMGQPRQNALLEAGMALKTHPDRTVIVEVGRMRPISNLGGMNTVRLSGTNVAQRLNELAARLETAECPVDRTGDWLRRVSTFENLGALTRQAAPGPSVIKPVEESATGTGAEDLVREIYAAAERAAVGLDERQVNAIGKFLLTAQGSFGGSDIVADLPAPTLMGDDMRRFVKELGRADVIVRVGPRQQGWTSPWANDDRLPSD